jgi:kynurenine formamidase
VLEFGWDRYLPDVSEERGPMWWASNQPALAADACAYLAGHGISAVACDTAACDFPAADSAYRVAPGHAKHFLHAGIPLVEGLNGLADVPATGLLLVLPLKIERDTVSPVRVLLLSE